MTQKTNDPSVIDKSKFFLTFYLPVDDKQIVAMLKDHGHKVTFNRRDYFDACLFTGGADVHPFLYGEKVHPTTVFDIRRDMTDITAYKSLTSTVPKIGICRGAQFLNVMSGGSLYQHVDGHAIPIDHEVVSVWDTSDVFPVSSTHHQMIRPGVESYVLLEADESKFRCTSDQRFTAPHYEESDVEAVYYNNTNSFGVQFHPEFRKDNHPCRTWFFDQLYTFFERDVARRRDNFSRSGVKV